MLSQAKARSCGPHLGVLHGVAEAHRLLLFPGALSRELDWSRTAKTKTSRWHFSYMPQRWPLKLYSRNLGASGQGIWPRGWGNSAWTESRLKSDGLIEITWSSAQLMLACHLHVICLRTFIFLICQMGSSTEFLGMQNPSKCSSAWKVSQVVSCKTLRQEWL